MLIIKIFKIRFKIDYFALIAFLGVFGLVMIRQSFAQGAGEAPVHVPEPASLALISTTGIFGYIIRFARRRFEEFKRIFDIVVSSTGLVLATPIIAFAAIVIKIVSPGPVFFRQQRTGRHGEPFNIYKLRLRGFYADLDYFEHKGLK